tara:strand:+ start:6881 stop:7054 length:174 start_codon:yes stop_codon:yes gene_type:complete
VNVPKSYKNRIFGLTAHIKEEKPDHLRSPLALGEKKALAGQSHKKPAKAKGTYPQYG